MFAQYIYIHVHIGAPCDCQNVHYKPERNLPCIRETHPFHCQKMLDIIAVSEYLSLTN